MYRRELLGSLFAVSLTKSKIGIPSGEVRQLSPQIQWRQELDDYGKNTINSVGVKNNSQYLFVGQTGERGEEGDILRGWLIQTDEAGNIEWNKQFGPNESLNRLHDVISIEGGWIVAGERQQISPDGTHSKGGWAARVDLNGNVEWQETLGGNDRDSLFTVVPGVNEGVLLAGETRSYGMENNDSGLWLVKATKSGLINWDIAPSLEEQANYRPFDMIQVDQGYLIAAWRIYFDDSRSMGPVLLKFDPSGQLQQQYDLRSKTDNPPYSVVEFNEMYVTLMPISDGEVRVVALNTLGGEQFDILIDANIYDLVKTSDRLLLGGEELVVSVDPNGRIGERKSIPGIGRISAFEQVGQEDFIFGSFGEDNSGYTNNIGVIGGFNLTSPTAVTSTPIPTTSASTSPIAQNTDTLPPTTSNTDIEQTTESIPPSDDFDSFIMRVAGSLFSTEALLIEGAAILAAIIWARWPDDDDST